MQAGGDVPAASPSPAAGAGGGIAEIARRVLVQITREDVRPGSRLPGERQLAQQLGVGRAALREVLAALELLGVVDSRHGSGTYLSENPSMLLPQTIEWGLLLKRPQTLQLVEARRHLEISLAGIAAGQRDPEGLLGLRRRLEEMRDAAAAGDLEAFVEADAQFHLDVARLSRNDVLSGMLHSVSSLLRVWMSRAVRADGGHVHDTIAEHTAVLDAIAGGRTAQAERAMREHIKNAESRLFRSLGDPPA